MAKGFNVQTYGITLCLALVTVTILNLMVKQFFPQITIISAGKYLILLSVAIILSMVFTFTMDKTTKGSEIFFFILVLATLIGVFWITKKYLPEIYSVIPPQTKEIFSFIK